MASSTPLKDTDLIDCARANAPQGVAIATQLCGYGDDINTFQQELKKACERIGVKFNGLNDLITDQQSVIEHGGVEVAPDTASEL